MAGIADWVDIVWGSVALGFATTLLFFFFGSRLSKVTHWILGTEIVLFVFALSQGWGMLVDRGFLPSCAVSNWFSSGLGTPDVFLGIMLDTTGLVFASLAVVLSAVALLFADTEFAVAARIRTAAAISLGMTGAMMGAVSASVWLSLLGLLILMVAGFLVVGAQVELNVTETSLSSRYLWQIGAGLGISTAGALTCSVFGANLSWDSATEWPLKPGVVMGAWLLVGGLILMLRSFPFLSRSEGRSQKGLIEKLAISEALLGWGVFIVFLRLEPNLQSAGVFPILSWLALLFAVLGSFCGLFVRNWVNALSVWLSSAWLIAICGLGLGGRSVGIFLCLAYGLGSLGITVLGSKRMPKGLLYLFCFALSGGLGFLAAHSAVLLIAALSDNGVAIALLLAGFFVLWLLIWMIVVRLSHQLKPAALDLKTLSISALLILILLEPAWTGSIGGGLIILGGEEFYGDFVNSFLSRLPGSANFMGLWGVLIVEVVAIVLGFWAWRYPDVIWRRFPVFAAFVAENYQIDRVIARVFFGAATAADQIEFWISEKFWVQTGFGGMGGGLSRFASLLSRFDKKIYLQAVSSLGFVLDGPGRILQAIQNGDFQWYVLFAVLAIMALLIPMWVVL